MKDVNIEEKIRSLTSFKEDLKKLLSRKSLLKAEIDAQKIPYSVHQVMIDCLIDDLSDVQKVIEYLEKKLGFESEVYERVKKICLSLTIDEENLHILETGSFTNSNDIVRMEKSLILLLEFSEKSYKLNIVKDREAEVKQVVSDFLKRFIIFLSKLFIQSETSSELKVHRSFYEKIVKYKFIYNFSKTFEDYYNVLCVAYSRKSKDLYNEEFKNHLNRVAELITNAESLKYTLDAIIMTYSSLLECEIGFIKNMEMQIDPKEIFSGVDLMITDFFSIFFKKSPYCVLISLHTYTCEDILGKLGSLGIELEKLSGTLDDVFTHQHKNSELSFEIADLINALCASNSKTDFLDKLMLSATDKAMDRHVTVERGIRNLQIIYSIEKLDDKEYIVGQIEGFLIPMIVERVFGATNEVKAIKTLVKAYDSTKKGHISILNFVSKVIIENCDPAEKDYYIDTLSKANQNEGR
ncbi:hypothetical protein GINT2_001004 [Glugoides intestinalis]